MGEVPSQGETIGHDLRVVNARPSYAFFIGRLERDFAHARQAIRAAVQEHAGIPLLTAEDAPPGVSIHSSTQDLIEGATFVIADLSLGYESPDRENASRAHEIGIAMARRHRLLLCSQEPRRLPYYSISDRQMHFWRDERELHALVGTWIADQPELRAAFKDPNAAVVASFAFSPRVQYHGPHTRILPPSQQWLVGASMAALVYGVSRWLERSSWSSGRSPLLPALAVILTVVLCSEARSRLFALLRRRAAARWTLYAAAALSLLSLS